MVLPAGWESHRVDEVGEVITGATPSTRDFANWDGDVPFVTPGDLVHLGTTTETDRTLTRLGATKARLIPPGSVLVTCIGTLGRTSLLAEPSTTNQQINAVIPKCDIDGRYLMYAFASPSFQAQLDRVATSTTVSLVNKSKFSGLLLAVPPLDTQQRIVAAIEEQFSRLDAAETVIARVGARLSVLQRAIIDRARGEGEPISLADALGPGALFTDGDWVETKDQNPAGEVRLIQLADVGDGVFRNRSNRFLTADTAARLKCTYLSEGDVLVARMPEPLGRACVFPGVDRPAVTAVDVCILRPAPSGPDPVWLMHALNASPFRRSVGALQSGTTRKRISRRNLASIQLPVPDRDRQETMAAEIESELSLVRALHRDLDQALTRADALRRAVLRDAFSGRLTESAASVQGRKS